MGHILIVEDEPQMRLGLIDNLEIEGYTVDYAKDGETGLRKIMENSYDLILLDIMLPRLSGFDLCKQIRQEGINTPVIMLTAKGEEIDKVLGLEIGADDYITKPFSLRELLARIKAALRRSRETESSSTEQKGIKIGKLEVYFQTLNALINDEPVAMTHKEFEILQCLWKYKNNTVSRYQLLDEVWGYDRIITTRTVDNFILKLRRKIEKDPAHPAHIITVHGIGYKLIP